jgi:hypothetical protein
MTTLRSYPSTVEETTPYSRESSLISWSTTGGSGVSVVDSVE